MVIIAFSKATRDPHAMPAAEWADWRFILLKRSNILWRV